MKKFFTLIAVLALTVVANAGISNVFDGSNIGGFTLNTTLTDNPVMTDFGGAYPTGALYDGNFAVDTVVLSYGYEGTIAVGKKAYFGLEGTFTGYDGISLTVSNDNNQAWDFYLYAVDSSDTVTYSSVISLNPTYPQSGGVVPPTIGYLSLGLSENMTYKAVGVVVENSVLTSSDKAHFSVAVPAPGAVLLSGLGTVLVGLVRRRSL